MRAGDRGDDDRRGGAERGRRPLGVARAGHAVGAEEGGDEDRQVGDDPEQADADRQRQVLVVEDAVLLLVVAAIAAADQRVGGEVGLDRFVVADPVLGRVDLGHRAAARAGRSRRRRRPGRRSGPRRRGRSPAAPVAPSPAAGRRSGRGCRPAARPCWSSSASPRRRRSAAGRRRRRAGVRGAPWLSAARRRRTAGSSTASPRPPAAAPSARTSVCGRSSRRCRVPAGRT